MGNYKNSDIYKLICKCGEGSYVSQAGRISVIKFSKHVYDDKRNVNKSQCAKHILFSRERHRRM